MDRRTLEGLGRDDLIARARAAGVVRPEVLTRVELLDEIVRRSEPEPTKRSKARGLLGRARDLIAEVVEKGLHLPETADRIRGHAASPPPRAPSPSPVATVTLAEIYAAQGHRDRAIAVLDEVLAREPEHRVARQLRARWQAAEAAPATRATNGHGALPPEEDEGIARDVAPPGASEALVAKTEVTPKTTPPPKPAMLDDFPLPTRYDVDETVILPVEPTTAYVYWEARPATIARARAVAPHGRLVVRVYATTNEGPSPTTTVRDVPAESAVGDYFVFGLPAGAVLRAALGWVVAEQIEAFALSPILVAPRGGPAPHVAETVVTWTPRGRPRAVASPSSGVALSLALARSMAPQSADEQPDEQEEPATAPNEPRRVVVRGGSSELWSEMGPPFGGVAAPKKAKGERAPGQGLGGASEILGGASEILGGASDLGR